MSQLNTVIKSYNESKHLAKGSIIADPFEQDKHKRLPYPIMVNKVEISGDRVPDITNSSSAARKVTWDLPTDMRITRIAVKATYTQTGTEEYRDHLGIGSMEKIEMLVGGQTKLDFANPRASILWGLNKVKQSNTRHTLLKMYNGYDADSTAADINVVSWLPLPWDPLVAPGALPLVTDKLKQPKLRITFKANSDILKATATGGSISVVSLLVYGYIIPQTDAGYKEVVEHKSFDIDFNLIAQSITSGTETQFDVKGIQGKIKELFITHTLSSDFLIDFYKLSPIDSIKDKLNNEEKDTFLNKTEGLMDTIMGNSDIGSATEVDFSANTYTIQECYKIPYGYVAFDNTTNDYGGIHSNNVQNHTLKIKQSNGTGVVDIIGIVGAKYIYTKNGGITKNT